LDSVTGFLFVIGIGAWIVGLVLRWQLQRRFQEKTGREMYGLNDIADRYLALTHNSERPERPRVAEECA
jgi:hypothetical protein